MKEIELQRDKFNLWFVIQVDLKKAVVSEIGSDNKARLVYCETVDYDVESGASIAEKYYIITKDEFKKYLEQACRNGNVVGSERKKFQDKANLFLQWQDGLPHQGHNFSDWRPEDCAPQDGRQSPCGRPATERYPYYHPECYRNDNDSHAGQEKTANQVEGNERHEEKTTSRVHYHEPANKSGNLSKARDFAPDGRRPYGSDGKYEGDYIEIVEKYGRVERYPVSEVCGTAAGTQKKEDSSHLFSILMKERYITNTIDRRQFDEWFKFDIKLPNNVCFHGSVGMKNAPKKAILLVDCYKYNLEQSEELNCRVLDVDELKKIMFYAENHGMVSRKATNRFLNKALEIDAEPHKSDECDPVQHVDFDDIKESAKSLFSGIKGFCKSLVSKISSPDSYEENQARSWREDENYSSPASDVKKQVMSRRVDEKHNSSASDVEKQVKSRGGGTQEKQQAISKVVSEQPKINMDKSGLVASHEAKEASNPGETAEEPSGYKRSPHSLDFYHKHDQMILKSLHIDLNRLNQDKADHQDHTFRNGILSRYNGAELPWYKKWHYSCYRVENGAIMEHLFDHQGGGSSDAFLFVLAFVEQYKGHPDQLPVIDPKERFLAEDEDNRVPYYRELMEIILMPLESYDDFYKAMQRYEQVTQKRVLDTVMYGERIFSGAIESWQEPMSDQFRYIKKVGDNEYDVGYSERGGERSDMRLYDVKLAYLYVLEYYCRVCTVL